MKNQITENQLLIYGAHTQIANSLQHYNRIQATYRTFASTWLLATFVGIGYALSSFEVNLPLHPLITVSFICIASAAGISLMWYMDLIIYEKFIASIVFEGLDLEKNNPWLPKFYTNVNAFCSFLNYINLKLLFYIGCISILFITMGTSLAIYLYNNHSTNYYLTAFFTVIIISLISYFLWISTKRSDPYYRLKSLIGGKSS